MLCNWLGIYSEAKNASSTLLEREPRSQHAFLLQLQKVLLPPTFSFEHSSKDPKMKQSR